MKDMDCWVCKKHGHIVADCPERRNNTIIWQKYAKANPNIAHRYKNKFPKDYKSKGKCFKGDDCTRKNCPYTHPRDGNQSYFVNSNSNTSAELPVFYLTKLYFLMIMILSFLPM